MKYTYEKVPSEMFKITSKEDVEETLFPDGTISL